MPKLNIHEPCPCESGKLLRDCCLKSGDRLLPSPCQTLVPPTQVQYSHPKCYASALCNCSSKISREHYISHGILSELAVSGMITVSGLPWQGDYHSPAKSSTGALVGKVLCTNHNSALSPLDEIAKKLAAKFGNVPNIFHGSGIRKDCLFYLFNGHDIERWILKILCGVIFSGNAAFRDNPIPKSKPPLEFLQVLFGSESLPRGWGLYFLGRIGDRFETQKNFTFAPIVDNRRILGCIVSVHQFRFLLAMGNPPDNLAGTLLEGAIYRPCCIQINDINTDRKIVFLFGWEEKGDDRGVTINFTSAMARALTT